MAHSETGAHSSPVYGWTAHGITFGGFEDGHKRVTAFGEVGASGRAVEDGSGFRYLQRDR